MALFRVRNRGHCAAGDIFIFTWWCESISDIDTVHAQAQDWLNVLWTGNATIPGYDTLCTADIGVDNVSTSQVDQSSGRQELQEETDVAYVGTATGNNLPADCSIVVSERTQTANRSGRGRFYLPQPYVGVLAADGLLSSATTTTVVEAAEAAFEAVQDTVTPVVYSRTYNSTSSITSVDVGNLMDTQRRRENALQVTRTRRAI